MALAPKLTVLAPKAPEATKLPDCPTLNATSVAAPNARLTLKVNLTEVPSTTLAGDETLTSGRAVSSSMIEKLAEPALAAPPSRFLPESPSNLPISTVTASFVSAALSPVARMRSVPLAEALAPPVNTMPGGLVVSVLARFA